VTEARANDIPPMDALEVFSKFQAGNIIKGRGPRMARGDVAPSFTLEMARKDVGLMMAAAKGEPLVALPYVAKRMDQVIGSGGGELDIAAIGARTTSA
jgi:3-hydroxyisobutyrate dehydrogenase-like beta-hydroxyacid dehydrogenase